MQIKTVSQCTLAEVLKAWNKGFEGYFVQIEMNEEMFLNRLVKEGLSPELSIIAFDRNNPVGIVLNGFREMDGKKIAWNGGTGIAPDYRGQGVSRVLMEETNAIYESENVEVATLEAIKENKVAIALYEKHGYTITNKLLFLSGEYEAKVEEQAAIHVETIRPEQLPYLFFIRKMFLGNVAGKVINKVKRKFFNENNEALGYMLYKIVWDTDGAIDHIVLYQLVLLENGMVEHIPHFIASITNHKVNLATVNFLASNPAASYLMENGLEIKTEQVQMKKKMD